MHSSSFKNTLLILFVRAPRPGSVKTRIAATAGPEVTLNIYRDMVGTLIHNLQDLPDVELRFTPDDGLEEITTWLQPGWTARTQGSGDLGARMENAFSEAFQSGFNKVALIGSDCPGIHRHDIQTAWSELDEKDLVLGPAADGGLLADCDEPVASIALRRNPVEHQPGPGPDTRTGEERPPSAPIARHPGGY